jgi:hypothetical protein
MLLESRHRRGLPKRAQGFRSGHTYGGMRVVEGRLERISSSGRSAGPNLQRGTYAHAEVGRGRELLHENAPVVGPERREGHDERDERSRKP